MYRFYDLSTWDGCCSFGLISYFLICDYTAVVGIGRRGPLTRVTTRSWMLPVATLFDRSKSVLQLPCYRSIQFSNLKCYNKTNHPMSRNSHPSVNANKARCCPKGGGGGGTKWTGTSYNIDKVWSGELTAVPENYSSSRMLIILTKVQSVCINSYNQSDVFFTHAGKFLVCWVM